MFKDWKFDFVSSFITVLLSPLIIYFLKIILGHLKRLISYLVDGLFYLFSRYIMHSIAAAFTLKRYCRLQLSKQNQYVFVPSSSDIKLNIDDVFVTLSLEQYGTSKRNFSHQTVLDAGNRIRVMGDPGSGKSSLVKRIFRDTCIFASRKPQKASLPIIVELKNLTIPKDSNRSNLGKWFYNYLRDEINNSAVYQMGECFDSYARTTGLLVLLDGLDEVSTADFYVVQEAINCLSQELSELSDKTSIILTMRTQFHDQIKDAFRDSFGIAMFIKPFRPTDIFEFLTRWPYEKDKTHQISRIYKDLTDRPSLREMCGNPLILSMYVAEDQASGHIQVPESRTEFYSKVKEELLIRRRQKQITGNMKAPAKLREQRELILGRIAYFHMLNQDQPANSLNWTEAIKIIRQVIKCKEAEAIETFNEIAKETGLICEERPGQSFRFIHLTFCEFFAAFEAVQGQKDGWTTLLDKHKDFQNLGTQLRSKLLEVIPFACGLLPRIEKNEAVYQVSLLNNRILLARCFLETKTYDLDCWDKYVTNEKQSLLSVPEEDWNEEWLRNLHLFNIVVSDANLCSKHMPINGGYIDLTNFLETLVSQQQKSIEKLLYTYASQDAAVAFRLAEICGLDLPTTFPQIIIKNADQNPFFALVIEQAFNDQNRIEFWASILVEAALGSRIVSKSLYNHESPDWIESYISTHIPKRRRWFQKGILKQTLLTQLITIAYNSPLLPSSSMNLIECVRKIPSPFFAFVEITILNISAFLFSICVAVLVIYYKISLNYFYLFLTTSDLSFKLLFVLLTLSLYLFTLRNMLSRVIYQYIVNGIPISFESKYKVLNLFYKEMSLIKISKFLLLNKLSKSVIKFLEARKEHNLGSQ